VSDVHRAVIFDLGGVVFPSPFAAFDAYDRSAGLEPGTVRALIRTSSEEGAWASLERGDITLTAFVAALEAEAAGAGFLLDATVLMQSIGARFGPRPQMVRAITRLREHGLLTAALTNNWVADNGQSSPNGLHDLLPFDVVVESSVEGLRKPDPRIYALTLERLGVPASEAIFLDDLGINLKPARELGITTIKVTDPDVALAELSEVVGFEVGR
jgi:putative hydrolase of the HAD superfamily